MLRFQPYTAKIRNDCVEIFRSNIPKFFLEHELGEYETHLDRHAQNNYWCAFDNQTIVGAGGIWVRPDGIGRLVYGLIRNDLHRRGYGRQLLYFRLKKLAELPNVEIIQLDTSQYNPEFFKRFGFREILVTANKFGAGLHSHEMELKLDFDTREKLLTLNFGDYRG